MKIHPDAQNTRTEIASLASALGFHVSFTGVNKQLASLRGANDGRYHGHLILRGSLIRVRDLLILHRNARER